METSSTHHFLAFVVEGRGSLVEKKNRWVVQDSAGDGDSLDKQYLNNRARDSGALVGCTIAGGKMCLGRVL